MPPGLTASLPGIDESRELLPEDLSKDFSLLDHSHSHSLSGHNLSGTSSLELSLLDGNSMQTIFRKLCGPDLDKSYVPEDELGGMDDEAEHKADGRDLLEMERTRGLLELLQAEPGARDVDRCVDISSPLQFFRRLSWGQSSAILQGCEQQSVLAGEYVFREGAAAGFLYVVVSGSVVIEKRDPDLGGHKAFVQTIYDGKAFGDLFTDGEDSDSGGVRCCSAIAQESTLLLRVATPAYLEAVRTESGSKNAALRLNAVFAGGEQQLTVLGMVLAAKRFINGLTVMRQGDRPTALWTLVGGACKLQVRAGSGQVEVLDMVPGTCFGHGAVLDEGGVCAYRAVGSVVVESSYAEFLLLHRRSLAALPDAIAQRILVNVGKEQEKDPILQDCAHLVDGEREWQKARRKTLSEHHRCCTASVKSAVVPRSSAPTAEEAKRLAALKPWKIPPLVPRQMAPVPKLKARAVRY